MFFFFVGGLEQQARQVLKSGAGRCIACGSRADLVEYEKVLKLFFVPVWRWPGKEPVMRCNDCNLFFPQPLSPPPPEKEAALRCGFCAREVDPAFRFCPFCGSAQWIGILLLLLAMCKGFLLVWFGEIGNEDDFSFSFSFFFSFSSSFFCYLEITMMPWLLFNFLNLIFVRFQCDTYWMIISSKAWTFSASLSNAERSRLSYEPNATIIWLD